MTIVVVPLLLAGTLLHFLSMRGGGGGEGIGRKNLKLAKLSMMAKKCHEFS